VHAILSVVSRLLGVVSGAAKPRTVAAAVLLALAVLLLAGCGSSRKPVRQSSLASLSRRVLLRGLENAQTYAAGGRLYVAQQVSRPGAEVLSELMRVDPVSGGVRAARRLASAFDQALLSHGVLWVTTTRGERSWLWQLDPSSLAVRSKQLLPGSGQGLGGGIVGTIALSGGWLWVGSWDRLDRVSPVSGHVTAAEPVRGAQGIDVAADAGGRVLIDSEGHEHARVQRRDPTTGRLIAQSPVYQGVSKPYVGGIFDGGVWISEATGMMGYIERLAVGTLKPTSFAGAQPHPGITAPPSIFGTNGISARMLDGILWVTQLAGGRQLNYCGDPLTGRSRAPLVLGSQAQLQTVDAGSVYYIRDASRPTEQELARAGIDSRCYTVRDVLRGDRIDDTVFGDGPSTVARVLDGLLGLAPSRPYHAASICSVDHEIQWTGLTAFFEHARFVGYAYWTLRAAGEPILATAKGLRVGDTFAGAKQIYGRLFQTSAAQGGSWAVRTPQGRLYGYATGPPIGGPQTKIASIDAGYVGCPALTP
jgi:hypothetical protein